jgi:hypothetical protein
MFGYPGGVPSAKRSAGRSVRAFGVVPGTSGLAIGSVIK